MLARVRFQSAVELDATEHLFSPLSLSKSLPAPSSVNGTLEPLGSL